jgi:alanine dehydrogenase
MTIGELEMYIGIPKEIKVCENRVSITEAGVKALKDAGHRVLIEKGAGLGSGITDTQYVAMGAELATSAEEVYAKAEMILKVKEPLPQEYALLRKDQILFTYLHLAANKELTQALMKREVVAIAYETIQMEDGSLPLLIPMSMVAGRLSIQVGAHYLEKVQGGNGMLLGGVPGVKPSKVVIVGGGTVGINAVKMAVGMGADVTVIEANRSRLCYLDDIFHSRVKTLASNEFNIASELKDAELVVGSVLIPGAKAQKLIREDMIAQMKPGSVIVDVAIDQGGCVEGTYPTTHTDPIFIKHGVIHYSVANMPGVVSTTSTYALANATLPYVIELANKGCQKALSENKSLALGLNVCGGQITYKAVADAFRL